MGHVVSHAEPVQVLSLLQLTPKIVSLVSSIDRMSLLVSASHSCTSPTCRRAADHRQVEPSGEYASARCVDLSRPAAREFRVALVKRISRPANGLSVVPSFSMRAVINGRP